MWHTYASTTLKQCVISTMMMMMRILLFEFKNTYAFRHKFPVEIEAVPCAMRMNHMI